MTKKAALMKRPVEGRILFIRGHKVLLDRDLAELYDVNVKRLNRAGEAQCRAIPAGLHVPAHAF